MIWFKYVIKTPLAQMRKDWKEYQDLKGQCARAVDKVGAAKSCISHMCKDDEAPIQGHACINYKMETKPGATVSTMSIIYCPEFYIENSKKECVFIHCPYLQKNKAYHAAIANAEDLRARKQLFWKEKFTNVR